MIFRVHHVDGEYRIVLRPEVVKELGLFEGAGVEICKVDLEPGGGRFISTEEAMAVFERTLPRYDAVCIASSPRGQAGKHRGGRLRNRKWNDNH